MLHGQHAASIRSSIVTAARQALKWSSNWQNRVQSLVAKFEIGAQQFNGLEFRDYAESLGKDKAHYCAWR